MHIETRVKEFLNSIKSRHSSIESILNYAARYYEMFLVLETVVTKTSKTIYLGFDEVIERIRNEENIKVLEKIFKLEEKISQLEETIKELKEENNRLDRDYKIERLATEDIQKYRIQADNYAKYISKISETHSSVLNTVKKYNKAVFFGSKTEFISTVKGQLDRITGYLHNINK